MQLTLWTYEGPPHVGAMRVATALQDVHYVLHAPQGDTYADLLFTMIERRNKRPPVTYTTFQARDLGKDTAELFQAAARDAYARFTPQAMLVGASCTAELIQDDPAGLAEAMRLPCPVVALELPSYQKKENWGAAETFYQLVRAFAGPTAPPPGTPRPERAPGQRPRCVDRRAGAVRGGVGDVAPRRGQAGRAAEPLEDLGDGPGLAVGHHQRLAVHPPAHLRRGQQRVDRVVDQVRPHLVQLTGRGLDLGHVDSIVAQHRDPAELVAEHHQRAVEAVGEIHPLHRGPVELGVGPHRVHQVGDPPRRLLDLREECRGRKGAGDPGEPRRQRVFTEYVECPIAPRGVDTGRGQV